MIQLLATAIMTFTTYLPIVSLPLPYPDYYDAGIAYSQPRYAEQLELGWYFDGNNTQATIDRGGVPLCWCDIGPSCRSIPATYHGPVLAINEPGGKEQCNRVPGAVAYMQRQNEQLRPDVQWISPNVIRPWVLAASLDAYRRMYGSYPNAIPGIHIYSIFTSDSWPGLVPSEPVATINRYCGVLEARGIECKLWVTEFGVCGYHDPDGAAMYRWTRDIMQHPAVERFAAYTAIWDRKWFPCDIGLIDVNGNMTVRARAYRAALHGWGWQGSNRR